MTEIIGFEGKPGNFTVTLKEHPRYVDVEKCISCGICAEKCPAKIPDEYNEGLSNRTAISIRYPQAVPLKYAIDSANCIYFKKGKGRACEQFCPSQAIDFYQQEKTYEVKVGSVILAIGAKLLNPKSFSAYGYEALPNVITSMELERILSSSGPFGGDLLRPSDRQPAEKIAWIQCVGSRSIRSESHGYCSGVCCMYSIKQAIIAKEHVGKDLEASIFFTDIRTHGKGFEDYYKLAKDEMGIRFVRSQIHTIAPSAPGSDDLKITYINEKGKLNSEILDLAVLSVGFEASKEIEAIAKILKISLSVDGFIKTNAFSLVETSRPGVFVCGTCSGPKDIPQSVMEASAASAAATSLLAGVRNSLTYEKSYPPETVIDRGDTRIGVFVCHCGINIGSVINVPEVCEFARTLPGVFYVAENVFTCSNDSQQRIRELIHKEKLNRVVIAACSPRTHEPLFKETIREAGLNPFLLEFTNIRDQDAWVHKAVPGEATEKAKDLISMAVSKVALSDSVEPLQLPITRSALVVGGGIAGMNAALELADQGISTYVLDKQERLGGYAVHLNKTWEGDEVEPYLQRLCDRVLQHENINVLLNAEIADVKGFVGNFITTVQLQESKQEIEHGAVVLATGAQPYQTDEYCYGQSDRITLWHELEHLFEKDPACLEESEAVAFIQCVGSREAERPYCSRICCTASVQQAIHLKTQKPDLNVYIFYRDMRTYGLRERLFQKARQLGVIFVRYSVDEKPVVKKTQKGGKEKLEIIARDPIIDRPIAFYVDYLNLYTAIIPERQTALANAFKLPINTDGFFMEAHAKLRPVEFSTDGAFVCGLAHYPKPIEESILQARAAAGRAANVLIKESVEIEPIVSVVDQDKCIGCGLCETVCSFGAVHLTNIPDKGFRAESIQALCKGCGSCAAACPQRAIDMIGFRDTQINSAIQAGGQRAMEAKWRPKMPGVSAYTDVSGYQMADDCYYHFGHSWVHLEPGGRVKIGVDEFITKILGPPDGLSLPNIGITLKRNQNGWLWKRNGDTGWMLSPMSGKVFALNKKVLEHPEIVHDDPFEEGWLLIMEPFDTRDKLSALFFERESIDWMEKENKKLHELLGPEYERLAATGGRPVDDLIGHFPEIGWDRLVKTFFHTKGEQQ